MLLQSSDVVEQQFAANLRPERLYQRRQRVGGDSPSSRLMSTLPWVTNLRLDSGAGSKVTFYCLLHPARNRSVLIRVLRPAKSMCRTIGVTRAPRTLLCSRL